MATRKVWYTLSAILMIGSFVSFYVYGLNFAIDFTGGISVETNFPKQVEIETVRKAVVAAGFHDPQVSYLGSTRDVTIGLQYTGQSADQVRPCSRRRSPASIRARRSRRWKSSDRRSVTSCVTRPSSRWSPRCS